MCEPSAQGIRLCLSMLADEAASLGLSATTRAIRAAMQACQSEARNQ